MSCKIRVIYPINNGVPSRNAATDSSKPALVLPKPPALETYRELDSTICMMGSNPNLSSHPRAKSKWPCFLEKHGRLVVDTRLLSDFLIWNSAQVVYPALILVGISKSYSALLLAGALTLS